MKDCLHQVLRLHGEDALGFARCVNCEELVYLKNIVGENPFRIYPEVPKKLEEA